MLQDIDELIMLIKKQDIYITECLDQISGLQMDIIKLYSEIKQIKQQLNILN